MDSSNDHYPFSYRLSREKLFITATSLAAVGALAVGSFVALDKFSDPVKSISESCLETETLTLSSDMTIGQLAIINSYKTGEDWRALRDRIDAINPALKGDVAKEGQKVFVPKCS